MTNKEFEERLTNIGWTADSEDGYFPSNDIKQLILDVIGENEKNDITIINHATMFLSQDVKARNEFREDLRRIVRGKE